MTQDTQVQTPVKPTMDELKAKVAAALASGNDTDFMLAVAGIAKMKAEVAKAQAEGARKEAEVLAGVRQKLGEDIHKAIVVGKSLQSLISKLAEVKASGFTYHVDQPDANGVMVLNRSVALLVPQVKAARKAGSGRTKSEIGKTKSEFGISLGEVYDKFANDEDKAKMAEASTNGQQWQVKVMVKNRALKEGLLTKAF